MMVVRPLADVVAVASCAQLGHPNVTGGDCPCGTVTHLRPASPRASFHLHWSAWWAGSDARYAAHTAHAAPGGGR